jgi:D-alanyl-D-alanine-carboxypeptidase/D-alanyl-D-alanine-endopeptidase
MKNRYLDIIAFPVVAISIATLLVNGVSAQAATPDVQKIIDDRVEAEYAPAIVVGIVRKDGTKEFYFSGTLQAGGTEEVDEDTIFEIGSISKVFTTLLMTLMDEEGDLEFSDNAQRFLPAGVSMPTKKGISKPNEDTPQTHITLEHLATHTSGLPRNPSNIIDPSDTPTEIWRPYADYTYQQMYDFLSSYELEGEIGREGDYSNLGVGLLGHILELQSGKSYEELLIARVCEPLGMHSTTTKPRTRDAARVAVPHRGTTPVAAWVFPTLAGAGTINSTLSDMLIFAAANMGQIDTPMAIAMRRCHAPRVNQGNTKIGLGWHIYGQPGTEITFHTGGVWGFCSFMGFRPDTGEGVVVLSNGRFLSLNQIGFHLLDEGIKLDKIQKFVKIDPRILSDYVGTYTLNADEIFTIKIENDQLKAMLTNQPFDQYYPTGRDEFTSIVNDAQFSFVRNRQGKVDRLVLHQNGRDQEALKMNEPSPE